MYTCRTTSVFLLHLQRKRYSVVLLHHQPQLLQLADVIFTAFYGVDAGGVDIAVAQNIGEPEQILFLAVVHPGKQVAQIVGKSRGFPRRVTKTGPAQICIFWA